jgi:hypothetical protein
MFLALLGARSVFLHLGLHVVAYLVMEQIGISLCCTTMLFTSEIFFQTIVVQGVGQN